MSWLPISILSKDGPQSVLASQTGAVVSQEASLTDGGSERMRLSFFIGRVTVTNEISLGMQHSTGYGVWADTKTDTSLTTKSADDTFTAATTDVCTAASHGFSDRDAFVVDSSGTLPEGLSASTVYYVRVLDENTFTLHTGSSLKPENMVDITSTGSGTHSLYAVSEVAITFNPEVAGDQSYLPLAQRIRAVVTTGADDTVDIVDVLLTQER